MTSRRPCILVFQNNETAAMHVGVPNQSCGSRTLFLLLRGAQSKGFATLRNERWPRKVPRFSVLFGYLTK